MSLLDSKIKFVLVRHEQAAAFMADMYGRLTQKVGVCLSTLGPGATNLTTGVANANMDRSPILVITGQTDTDFLHKAVSYTHLRAHETPEHLVCRLLLEKKKK